MRQDNPFVIRATVRHPFFTDRANELALYVRRLQEPSQKTLVYGPRRMGKTSTAERVEHSAAVIRSANSATGTSRLRIPAECGLVQFLRSARFYGLMLP